MATTVFHPKGSMCLNCIYRGADCSAFNFASMKVLAQYSKENDPNIFKVVICNEFKKTLDSTREAAEKFFPEVGEECMFRSVGSLYAEEFVWCKYHGKMINNEGLIIELVKTSPPLTCVDSYDPNLTEFKKSKQK